MDEKDIELDKLRRQLSEKFDELSYTGGHNFQFLKFGINKV